MPLPPTLAPFISGPVLMTLAIRDAANRPMIARGSGGRVVASGRVDVAVSGHLWPETLANVRDNGMLATTFVQPDDYRAFQLKGRAIVRAATPVEIAEAEAYVVRTEAVLQGLGVPRAAIRYWLTARDVAIVSLAVDRAFEQTPGPRAGTTVG